MQRQRDAEKKGEEGVRMRCSTGMRVQRYLRLRKRERDALERKDGGRGLDAGSFHPHETIS